MVLQECTVRHAEETDVGTILALIKELALYEKEPHAVEATEQSLLQTLSFALPSHPAASQLSSSKTLEAHTAWSHGYARTLLLEVEEEGKVEVAGMALYFFNYSTWRGRQGIYLEDLFVREKFRRRGYGVRLFKELAGIVKRMEGGRLDWSVLKWNEPSIKFYESLGAKAQTEWMTMRLEGADLDKLAETGNVTEGRKEA